MGAELHYTERGGDVTFHGPRQAVLYLIISFREIGLGPRRYVENLESTMIELASLDGVEAHPRRSAETGVWVGDRKIGAIGIRILGRVTYHELAFNVHPDLNYFKHIVPCGITGKEVTSLQREVTSSTTLDKDDVEDKLISCFIRQLGYTDVIHEHKDSLLHTEAERK
ncbi:hypothetical protein MLD38_040307 [Melastoma candidum]|uniref:Uncharacterized protein n=1 Tax=Melastoma candidum TaxID=119954 RepID=A0ACB9L6X5_9MYRT|nr:hypothetical protein MLD38_040307 [Melastoma candidum]